MVIESLCLYQLLFYGRRRFGQQQGQWFDFVVEIIFNGNQFEQKQIIRITDTCKIKQMPVHILEIVFMEIGMGVEIGTQLLQKIKTAVPLSYIAKRM